MKKLLSICFLFFAGIAVASDCHPPSQGFLEGVLKENFHALEGEAELKEWMNHPSNYEIKNEIKALDRRSKFSTRLKREELLGEAQMKFEKAIINNGRPDEMENFPVAGTRSKISSSYGALTLEMSNFSKEELNVIPKEILDKLEPKVRINYYYPYDKFEYMVTYNGKEQPMNKALQKVQADMEAACEVRVIENGEYRNWYNNHGGGAGGGSKSTSTGGGKSKGGSGQ